jgi:hypothetical protein
MCSSVRSFLSISSHWLEQGCFTYPCLWVSLLLPETYIQYVTRFIPEPVQFSPEDGGSVFLRDVIYIHKSAQYHSLEYHSLIKHSTCVLVSLEF